MGCVDCGRRKDEDFCCGYDCEDCDYFESDEFCEVFGEGTDEPWDGFRDAVDADADVLRMAGMGTDEDYGYYGDEFDYFGGDEG